MKKANRDPQLALREKSSPVPVNSPEPCRARGSLTTHKWQQKFLNALKKTPSVKHSCLAAGVSRSTVYRQRETDAAFAEKWDENIAGAVDDLEVVAFKLASEGDSRLIEFLLKSHRPQVYRDIQRHEVGVAGGIILLPAKAEGNE